jgi:integration host factor subunit beta
MTKRDLIDEVMKRYPRLSTRDAESVVNAVFDSMADALACGGRIEMRGFGTFVLKHRQAREATPGPARSCRSPRSVCRGSR